jgi:hypothetical protein
MVFDRCDIVSAGYMQSDSVVKLTRTVGESSVKETSRSPIDLPKVETIKSSGA